MHTERDRLAHLMRRAAFGATPEEIEVLRRKGLAAAVAGLVDGASVPEDFDGIEERLGGEILDFNDAADLKAWWLFRMIRTRRPLVEKMTLFWHGHFATSNGKVESGPLMQRQNDLFRRHALGNFRDLLLAVSKDPAMLRYLDGNLNRKGKPNENYGREVMELFTLGIGNYSEDDVKAAARAFTGWHVRENEFFFNEKQHDDGEKEFLGTKGDFDGADVVGILAAHPQTARFLAKKLCRFFVCEEGDRETEETIAAEFLRTGGNLGETLRKLFLSDRFYSEEFLGRKVKSPVELVAGAMRALYGKAPLRIVARVVARLGQDLFYPPSVKGWDGGLAWINTSTAVERLNLMKALSTGVGGIASPLIEPGAWIAQYGVKTPEQGVDHFLARFGLSEISPEIRQKIVEYVKAPPANVKEIFPAGPVDAKVRGCLHLVLCLPEYQLC